MLLSYICLKTFLLITLQKISYGWVVHLSCMNKKTYKCLALVSVKSIKNYASKLYNFMILMPRISYIKNYKYFKTLYQGPETWATSYYTIFFSGKHKALFVIKWVVHSNLPWHCCKFRNEYTLLQRFFYNHYSLAQWHVVALEEASCTNKFLHFL